ncbi:MAG: AIR synthase-related protein, partial [Paracoccaceae bacterium]|nr:AIR synthase-related protein [Paracoccaceae bacterium]
GAEALSAAGYGSTLLPANRTSMAKMFLNVSARSELLFDPQTAGGLLAAVAAESLDEIRERFRAAGENVSVIGQINEGKAFLTVEG